MVYNVLKSPRELRPHPLNKSIYGDEIADSDLVDSIRRNGILEPLVIRDDNVILSGHRRLVAARELDLDKIPCRIISFSDPVDEEEALIEFNRQRKKIASQLVAESRHLERIYEGRRGRPPIIYKHNDIVGDVANNLRPERGEKTKDFIAEKIGIGQKQHREMLTIWDKADQGDETAKKLVKEIDTGKKTVHTAFNEIKKTEDLERRREELAAKNTAASVLPDTIQIHHADFLKHYTLIEEGSVDCIITDPPYVKEWLDNFEPFAIAARHVLKPGGFLVAYVGHIHLDKILDQMTNYLDFYWIACLKHAGTAKAVHSRSVQCYFKPIIILQKPPRTKPKRYFGDVVQGTGREKTAHEWQQGEEELRQIFEPFTDPGDLVLDPFMGSGTVIAMAKQLNRRAIGFDIDPVNVDIVKGRVCA